MLILENINCSYGNKTILSDVCLTIRQKQLTCLLGKNDVGKTTLFKTMLGLLSVQKGKIHFNGKNIQTFTHKETARLISYAPRAHAIPFPFKVIDVVLMEQFVHSDGLFSRPQKQNVNIAMHSLEILGIGNLANKCFSKISGGQKQMVLIARALAQQPKFIAMDEPTANLDIGNSIRVMKIAQELKNQVFGVIMNTHAPEQALQFADDVVLLDKGGVIKTGTPDAILNPRIISELFNTPVEIVEAITSKGKKREILLTV